MTCIRADVFFLSMFFSICILALVFFAVFVAVVSVVVVVLYEPSMLCSRIFDAVGLAAIVLFMLFLFAVACISSCSA